MAASVASGELTTEPSFSAPPATVGVPTTTPTSPPGDDAPGHDSADPNDACGRPAPPTTTTETTSPPGPTGGGGGFGAVSAGRKAIHAEPSANS